jgi:hypothetical protein
MMLKRLHGVAILLVPLAQPRYIKGVECGSQYPFLLSESLLSSITSIGRGMST